MSALSRKGGSDLKVVEYAQQDGWMLGSYSENGYVVSNCLFLVCDHVGLSADRLSASVEQINKVVAMGRGYTFKAFADPCLGCEVIVSEGWELSNQVMKNNFLARFVKAVALGEPV